MKKKLSSILVIALLLQPIITKATYDNVALKIDDKFLLNELLQNADKNKNGLIEVKEANSLTKLYLDSINITDISALSDFPNLTTIITERHSITDISTLANLTNLTYVDLKNDSKSNLKKGIEDVTPLANLKELTYVNLNNNNVSDITPLASLTNLKNLMLEDNNVSDIKPLRYLKDLTVLNLKNNPIYDYLPLGNLKKLSRLYVDKDKISDMDKQILKDAGINVYSVALELEKESEFLESIPIDNPNLPYNKLEDINNKDDAVYVMEDIVYNLTDVQKEDVYITELVTNYAEEAIMQVASKSIQNQPVINYDFIVDLEKEANVTADALTKTIEDGGVALNREIERNILLTSKEEANATLTLDTTLTQSQRIDNLRIETKDVNLEVDMDDFKEEYSAQPLKIQVNTNGTGMQNNNIDYSKTSYSLSFGSVAPKNPVTVALPTPYGNTDYLAAYQKSNLLGGSYNPATDKIEFKTNLEGEFIVQSNQQDFTDIVNKSQEMQEAINILTAKGIMDGKTANQFGPDAPVTRAEMATMLVKTIYAYDATARSNFLDVFEADWFFAGVGSATNENIMKGYDNNTFKPNDLILKGEAISVTSRVLQNEKGYSIPSDIEYYLAQYVDSSDIPNWAKSDIAFATRENLIVKRTDGMFYPNGTLTRGEVAIILKKLFDRIV